MPAETKIERAEEQRDLKKQIQGLDRQDEQEIIFKETSPRRKKTRIWHMRNGQAADVPEYMAMKALEKIDRETGEYMFTAYKDRAPEYKPGTVLCFMHKDAPDQYILEELGLAVNPCRKSNLGNEHSKRMHGIHKHHDEWKAYQALLESKEKAEDRAAQRAQLDATLALAGRAAAVSAEEVVAAIEECPDSDCGYTGTSAQLRGHKSVHNKAEAASVS